MLAGNRREYREDSRMTQRARAVVPWSWARILRDHGPRSRDFRCAMLTLRTWMNDDGFAYPSLRTWAQGACMSVNTLTKHYKAALRDGWLGVERNPQGGQSWKRNCYRAAVPVHIQLPEKDEQLSDALLSEFGDINDDGDGSCVTQSDTPTPINGQTCVTQADTPSAQQHEAVSPIADTPSSVAAKNPGVLTEFGERCVKSAPEGVSKNGEGVSNYPPDVYQRCVSEIA
jgi:hypothetical protein